jgi:predicted  nucleic acid-binding Zn-ribbon protein
MNPALVGWLAFGAAALAAVFLFVRLRGAEAEREVSLGALSDTAAELEATKKRLEQRANELRARGEELSELRKKFDKLKRRAGDEREEEKSAPARIRALEGELAAEKLDSRSARDEIVRLHAEQERLSAELAQKTAKLGELVPVSNPAELEELRKRAADAEAKLSALAPELDTARRDVAKFRGRWETLDKAYVVLRSELEMKKDEARHQRAELERLRALEVVLVEPTGDAVSSEAE